ncbi:MAG: YkgJ family cysteine cluster protein [Planctomycetota bacterium]|jgi:Fe-S-cluster containining protein
MKAWYADGLGFQCTQCGHCCTGPQGYVWVSPRDQEAIAGHLGLTREEFRRRYLRLVGHLFSLVDKPNGDCIFLDENRRCSIHPVKPRQCLTFPFWPRLTASPESWRDVTEVCPGAGAGPRYDPGEIRTIQDRETPREVICRIVRSKRA